jgi:hypothetical protein
MQLAALHTQLLHQNKSLIYLRLSFILDIQINMEDEVSDTMEQIIDTVCVAT